MSIHFHPLTVKEVKKETADCVTVAFDIPEQLKKDFQFKQGQNLTMRATINGEEVRRTYSICSAPSDNEWKVAIKKVSGGLFSTYANEKIRKGDVLEVMEPVGKFYAELDPANRKRYVAFAAGSGITPVLSIIKTTLLTESGSHFTLIYGNRNRSSVIFFEELEALKNRFIDRFSLVHVLSRERTDTVLNSGRIDPAKLKELSRVIDYTIIDDYFLCGPEEMIFAAKEFLESAGVDKKKIHFELFSSAGQPLTVKNKESKPSVHKEGAGCQVTIKLDGRSLDFTLPFSSDTTILDAAMQKGADLPYACKGGMCCTCKAKLLEGEVSMDVHWGLEEDEVEKGFILTCQSHPKTEKVVVDFDIK